jgi:hypothetical protein
VAAEVARGGLTRTRHGDSFSLFLLFPLFPSSFLLCHGSEWWRLEYMLGGKIKVKDSSLGQYFTNVVNN